MNEDIQVSFDFDTGNVELHFEDKGIFVYPSELGEDIADLFEELIQQAFDEWLKKNKRIERRKDIH